MPIKKIRIYELARELGVENDVVLQLATELKIGVKSHSSSIEDPMADRVRRLADSKGLRKVVEVEEPPSAPATPAPAPEQPAHPSLPSDDERAAAHRLVRSTGGIPEPEPIAPAPAARNVSSSLPRARTSRPISSAAINKAVRAAMPPKTPSATASGVIACWTMGSNAVVTSAGK